MNSASAYRSHLIAFAILGWLFASSGCIYKSAINDKSFRLPKGFAEKGASTKKSIGRWWKVFDDGQLDRLIGAAFKDSLTLEQARARVLQARSQLKAAKAGWYPSINAKLEGGRSSRPFAFGALSGNQATNSLSLSLAASYEFDIWGKTRYAAKSAKLAAAAAEEQLRAGYISLAAQVAETYYLVVAAREQLRLLDQTIDNRKRLVEIVKRRYNVGVVTAVDLYQAQGNLAGARANQQRFVNQLKTAEHALAVLIGRYPKEIKSGTLDKLPEKVKSLAVGSPATMFKQRPDLRAAHKRLLATDARVGAALAQHFPSLSFSANIGRGFVDPAGWIWGLLGSLTAPLFQGGRIDAEVKRNRAVLKEELATFKILLLNAVKEVEDARVAGRTQSTRVKHLEEQTKSAEGALRLSTDQYAQGLLTYITVLTSEQQVYAARSELINARRELISARIQLARAMGGSWMDREIAAQKKREEKKK